MKTVALLALVLSFSALAGNCRKQAEEAYKQQVVKQHREWDQSYGISADDYSQSYEEAYLSRREAISIDQAFDTYDSFSTDLEGADYEVYVGVSEYMSGYGEDAVVVEKSTCKAVEFINVYAE